MRKREWLTLVLCLTISAGLPMLANAAAPKVDVCAIYKKNAPKDMGLRLEQATSATPEFCQAWSQGNKDTIMLRVSSMGKVVDKAVSGTRQSATNSGKKTLDEPDLGVGAWSQRNERGIEITFAVKDQLVMVLLARDSGFGDADAVKARAFAKAVAAELR